MEYSKKKHIERRGEEKVWSNDCTIWCTNFYDFSFKEIKTKQ